MSYNYNRMVSVYAILFYTILGLSLGYLGLKIYPKINRTIGGNKPIVSIIVSMLMMFSIFIPFIILNPPNFITSKCVSCTPKFIFAHFNIIQPVI